MFHLRDYEKRDFEHLFKLDRLCFDPGIAYSRAELASFIQQRRATTIVAEWNLTEESAPLPTAAQGIAGKEPPGEPAAARTASTRTSSRARSPLGSAVVPLTAACTLSVSRTPASKASTSMEARR